MNAVDRMDQLRSNSPTQRRQRHVYMSILSWILDLSINNASAVYKQLKEERISYLPNFTYKDFKRCIAEQLVLTQMDRRMATVPSSMHSVTCSENEPHILLKSSGPRPRCFVCAACAYDVKVSQFCLGCERGFHINCFAAYHQRELFLKRPEILQVLNQVDEYEALKSKTAQSSDIPNINAMRKGM